MNWVVVLVLAIVTLGIFVPVQLIIQASWVKRATGNAKTLNLALAAMGVYVLMFVLAIALMFSSAHSVVTLVQLAYLVLFELAAFATRDGVSAVMGIEMNGVLTFLFSSIYLQYKLNQVTEGSAATAAPVYPGQAPQAWGAQPQPSQPYGQPPVQPATTDWNQTVPYGRPAYQPQQPAQPKPPYGQPQQPPFGQPQGTGQPPWPQVNPGNQGNWPPK